MSFAIMRFEKRNAGNITGMFIHNERKSNNHSNEDIDVNKSHLNYQLIECESYKKAINEQIEKRYKQNRNIRVDAVLGVEVVFTSDNDFFRNLTEEDERRYFEKSLEFLKKTVGEENVISATVHKDESTPHLHCVFVPLDSQGRLRYKSFVNGRNDLTRLQDEYYNYITKDFKNLERGKNSKESRRKHLDVEEYKFETKKKNIELRLDELNSRELELKNVEVQSNKVDDVIKNTRRINAEEIVIHESDFRVLENLSRMNKLKELEEEKKEKEKYKLELQQSEVEKEEIRERLKKTSEKELEYKMKLVKLLSKNDKMKKELAVINSKKNFEKILKHLDKDSQNLVELFEKFLNEVDRENRELSERLREKYKHEWREKTLYSDIINSEIRLDNLKNEIEVKSENVYDDNNNTMNVDVSKEQEQLLLEKLLLIARIEIYHNELEKMNEEEKEKYDEKLKELAQKKINFESEINDFDYATTSKIFSKLIENRNQMIEENKKYTELRKELLSSPSLSAKKSQEITRKIVANNRKIKVINLVLKNVNSKMKIEDNQFSRRMTNFKERNDRFLNDNLNRIDNKIRIIGVDNIVIEEEDVVEREAQKILGARDYRATRGRETRGRGR